MEIWTVFTLGIALISISLAIFSLRKVNEIANNLQKEVDTLTDGVFTELENALKPVKTQVSRAMSDRAMKSANVRQERKLNELIAGDIINQQDPLIQGALELFPQAKEYLEKNPHLLPSLIPRLQELSKIEGFKLTDLISPSSSGDSSSLSSRRRLLKEE